MSNIPCILLSVSIDAALVILTFLFLFHLRYWFKVQVNVFVPGQRAARPHQGSPIFDDGPPTEGPRARKLLVFYLFVVVFSSGHSLDPLRSCLHRRFPSYLFFIRVWPRVSAFCLFLYWHSYHMSCPSRGVCEVHAEHCVMCRPSLNTLLALFPAFPLLQLTSM